VTSFESCPGGPPGPIDRAPAGAPDWPIELIVGLGNPGEEYARTRHNVGFRVAEEVAARHPAGGWVHRRLCDVAPIAFGSRLLAAKPLTYMNRSGRAVVWLLEHLVLAPEQMLVVLDDVDLPLGTLRLRAGGGPGTHNGLRDICDRIGRSFPRLRLGVGGGGSPQALADFVLAEFTPDEAPLAERMVQRAADAVETSVHDGLVLAMSRHNGPDEPGGP